MARLGADRALSRSEIDKLALYAHGKSVIDEEDVEIAVGDAAELALDRIVMAAGSANVAAALAECDRSIASRRERAGRHRRAAAPFPEAAPHARGARCRPAHGGGSAHACARRRISSRSDALEQQGRNWSAAKLSAALARIAEAAKAARLNSALEGALAEKLLLDLGQLSGQRKA